MLRSKDRKDRAVSWRALLMLALLLLGAAVSARAAFAGLPTSTQPIAPTQNKPSAQQQSGKTKPQASAPSSGRNIGGVAAPAASLAVLYDQYNNPGTSTISSQDFETSLDSYNDQAADDFTVPSGQSWQVNEVDAQGVYFNGNSPGPAASFNVYFYATSGTLPGTPVYTATNQAYTVGSATNFTITLASPAALSGGASYWVSVQARMDFSSGRSGQWGWTDRTVTSGNPAAWRNPGGGFTPNCLNWGVKTTCQGGSSDNVYRLVGNVVAQGTSTATAIPTSTAINTATVTATASCGGSGTPGPWVVKSPVPYVARGMAVASDGTYVYTNGGINDNGTVYRDTYRYDPVANTWTQLAPFLLTTARFQAPAAYGNNGKIYFFGGYDLNSSETNTTRIYDIASNTWSLGAVMPASRANSAVGYYNGKIYVAGGVEQQQLWSYDIASNAWNTALPNMPGPVSNSGFGVINGKLYVAGGNANNNYLNTLYVYDIASNTWSQGPNLPQGVNAPGSAVVGGGGAGSKLWVFGGGTPFRGASGNTGNLDIYGKIADKSAGKPVPSSAPDAVGVTQIYDPAANSWSAGPALNVARLFLYGAATNNAGTNAVVAPGGFTDAFASTNDNEVSLVPQQVCGTITPTSIASNTRTATTAATNTPTATNTAQATGTAINTATTTRTATAIGTSTSTATQGTVTATPTCQSGWSIVASPNGPTSSLNTLNSVAVVSPNDVWAVGSYINTNVGAYQTLIEHWNGASWSIVPSPNATGDSILASVSVISANDIWAVGDYYDNSMSLFQTLTEHWNGTAWSVVSSPNVGTRGDFLTSVSVVSTNDVWAVGYYYTTTQSGTKTLTEHWDGTTWNVVSSPNGNGNDASNNSLLGVSVVSANDVWAVGNYTDPSFNYLTLIEHWNGTAWSIVLSPNPSTYNNVLNAISVRSANDIWAVGVYAHTTPSGTTGDTLIIHWNGSVWSVVSSPNVTGSNELYAVSAASTNNVWAVGEYYDSTNSKYQTLTEHWDGTAWSIVPSPNTPTGTNWLLGVATVSSNEVWAVGFGNDQGSSRQTLIERYIASCATPTITTTPPPITTTPTATPSCVPVLGGWVTGPSFPGTLVRAVGVYFPDNGKFYTMGGRPFSSPGSEYTHPFEYNPATNSWAVKGATFPDNRVNNMACGVLNLAGGNKILCVGGSAAGETVAIDRAFYYDPIADSITPLPNDPWPGDANGITLPGGFTVDQGKLYILGGFEINVRVTDQIYQFDPNAAAGSRWMHKSATLPVAMGYIPTTTIGNLIYIGGGSTYRADIGFLIDSDNSYVYNPVADTIAEIARIPRATGETRAITYNGEMWVLGGGQNLPDNPSNEVDIYNPGSGQWRTGQAFVTARRDFPADTDGSHIWIAGGYGTNGGPLASLEIYSPGVFCGTPTPIATTTSTATSIPTSTATRTSTTTRTSTAVGTTTPAPTSTSTSVATATDTATTTPLRTPTRTAVATSTNTITTATVLVTETAVETATETVVATETTVLTATPIACTIQFADVPPSNTFYTFVRCLACRNIIGGYPCGGAGEPCNSNSDPYYRYNNPITRGQISKVVALSAGYSNPAGTHIYEDVPEASPFYLWIQQLSHAGVMGGYSCGTRPDEPCIAPDNRPYFRPNSNASRGQLSKIVSNAAGFSDPISGQTYTDVPPESPFYVWIERLSSRNVMGGYPCGGSGEPCDAFNRPYFRPNANVTRGQAAKIDANTFFPSGSRRN